MKTSARLHCFHIRIVSKSTCNSRLLLRVLTTTLFKSNKKETVKSYIPVHSSLYHTQHEYDCILSLLHITDSTMEKESNHKQLFQEHGVVEKNRQNVQNGQGTVSQSIHNCHTRPSGTSVIRPATN